MSEDPRFVAWLEATQSPVAAEGLAPEALELALQARAELRRSLEQDPPAQAPSLELAQKLARAEERLLEATRSLSQCLRARIDELRHVRSAASGYKPSHANHPAFISKSV